MSLHVYTTPFIRLRTLSHLTGKLYTCLYVKIYNLPDESKIDNLKSSCVGEKEHKNMTTKTNEDIKVLWIFDFFEDTYYGDGPTYKLIGKYSDQTYVDAQLKQLNSETPDHEYFCVETSTDEKYILFCHFSDGSFQEKIIIKDESELKNKGFYPVDTCISELNLSELDEDQLEMFEEDFNEFPEYVDYFDLYGLLGILNKLSLK